MGKIFSLFLFTCMAVFISTFAFAQETVEPTALLAQVMELINSFGGLTWVGKVSAVIAVIISSMKVSFLNKLVWEKLGAAKVWLAPLLGLIGGVLDAAFTGTEFSWSLLIAYMTAGAGAIPLHELLDSVKAIPGIGSTWVSIIDVIKALLGGPKSQKKIA